MSHQRVSILGVPMDCVSMDDAVLLARELVQTGRQGAIFAVNPEKVIQANEDPVVMDVLNAAEILIPDGIGAVLAARLGGVRGFGRVAGADLMPRLCQMAADLGTPVFLYGARPGVANAAAAVLTSRYSTLQIAGVRDGYVSDEDQASLIKQINDSGAVILFVALGSPRQEMWVKKNLSALTSVRICQGVGGTFDVLAGRVPRAPLGWQRVHLEWLYRLLKEPVRLRRFPRLVGFMWRILRDGQAVTTVQRPART